MIGPHGNTAHDGPARRGRRGERGDADTADLRFQRLVDRSPDGIVVHRDGRIVYVNATAVRWVGAQYADQVRGHLFTDFLHPHSVEPALTRMQSWLG